MSQCLPTPFLFLTSVNTLWSHSCEHNRFFHKLHLCPSTYSSLGYTSRWALFNNPFLMSPASIRPTIDISEQGDSYIVEVYIRKVVWVHYTKSNIGWQCTGAAQ